MAIVCIHSLVLCEELGIPALSGYDDSERSLFHFIRTATWEQVLDAIEVAFVWLSERRLPLRGIWSPNYNANYDLIVVNAIETLNERFRENALGYRFENGAVIRIDSEFIHAETIKPTLALLQNSHFRGANDEFMAAFEHYRHGRNKECLNECLKAFESTLKTICAKRGWKTNGSKSSDLVKTCISRGLLPAYLTKYFEGIEATLVGSIAPLRNEISGHGQGLEPISVPEYLVRYGLNVTATAILLLVEADQALPNTKRRATHRVPE